MSGPREVPDTTARFSRPQPTAAQRDGALERVLVIIADHDRGPVHDAVQVRGGQSGPGRSGPVPPRASCPSWPPRSGSALDRRENLLVAAARNAAVATRHRTRVRAAQAPPVGPRLGRPRPLERRGQARLASLRSWPAPSADTTIFEWRVRKCFLGLARTGLLASPILPVQGRFTHVNGQASVTRLRTPGARAGSG